MSFDEARESVLRRIKDRHFFFWKNAAGKTVACCAFSADGELARVNHVLTLSEERRRHYAQSLVCTVTELVREQGFRPALNADADYPASNACYRSIGYVPRGVVCKLAAKK